MSTAIDKQQIYQALETLSPESLAEVAHFIERLRTKPRRGEPQPVDGLEGLWEGVEFTEEDIAPARREMGGILCG
jgi:hypothetical protein